MSERFEVVTALEAARSQLRGAGTGRPDPGAALRLLRPFEASLLENPSLLYWTARANHLVRQDGSLGKDVRLEHLERADRLFAKHAELFKSHYAKDSRLLIRLDRHRLDGEAAHLDWVEKEVRARLVEGSQTAKTFIFRGIAHRRQGRLKEALEAFREAARLAPGDSRIKDDIKALRLAIQRRKG